MTPHSTPSTASRDGKSAAPGGDASPIYSTLKEEDMRDLVLSYALEMPVRAGQLVAAFEAGDAGRMAILSHQIKGSAGGYGYDAMTEVASRVEAFAEGKQFTPAARSALEELVAMAARIRAAFPDEQG